MSVVLEKNTSSGSLAMSTDSESCPRAPIEHLLSDLFTNVLKLPDVDFTPYARKLRDNLVLDTFILARLKEGALDKLNLPVALESELKRFIAAENALTVPVHHRDRSASPQKTRRMTNGGPTHAQNSSILGLTPDSIRLIKESWKQLMTRETVEGGPSTTLMVRLGRFFNFFYSVFLEKDPLGRKLFEGAPMQVQSQALLKMMKFIVEGLDNPVHLVRPLQKLGVRHLIYGVELKKCANPAIATDLSPDNSPPCFAASFQTFGLSLAQSFETSLGKAICTAAMKEAWYLLVQSLAEIMTKQYASIKAGFYTPIYYRNSRGKWGVVEAYLNHEQLIIFTDTTHKKVRNQWMLANIDSLEIVDDAARLNAVNSWCFAITLESTVTFYFCTTSEEELLDWTNDLTERIEAYQRVGRFVSSDGHSSGDEELSDADGKAKAKRKASRLREGLNYKLKSTPAK